MPAERFYSDSPLTLNDTIILRDQEFHHLKHVMRITQGQEVEVVNGAGVLAIANVGKLAKDHVALTIVSSEITPQPIEEVILVQAMPRSNRLDFILEKGTELGVTQFWLFPSFHSPRKQMTENQVERMQALTIAAMKQCGRLHLPHVILKPPLSEWSVPPGRLFFGDVCPGAPRFLDSWKESKPTFPVLFFTGPESGFTEDEVNRLKEWKAQGVKLHSHILRTETASLVALSLIEAALNQ